MNVDDGASLDLTLENLAGQLGQIGKRCCIGHVVELVEMQFAREPVPGDNSPRPRAGAGIDTAEVDAAQQEWQHIGCKLDAAGIANRGDSTPTTERSKDVG